MSHSGDPDEATQVHSIPLEDSERTRAALHDEPIDRQIHRKHRHEYEERLHDHELPLSERMKAAGHVVVEGVRTKTTSRKHEHAGNKKHEPLENGYIPTPVQPLVFDV